MLLTEETFVLSYEKKGYCEMTYQEGTKDPKTILKMEDNDNIKSLIGDFSKICKNFFESRVDALSKTMGEKPN